MTFEIFEPNQPRQTTVAGLGDRDTTCAIAGGIVALAVGPAAIPSDWLSMREPLARGAGLTLPRREPTSKKGAWPAVRRQQPGLPSELLFLVGANVMVGLHRRAHEQRPPGVGQVVPPARLCRGDKRPRLQVGKGR